MTIQVTLTTEVARVDTHNVSIPVDAPTREIVLTGAEAVRFLTLGDTVNLEMPPESRFEELIREQITSFEGAWRAFAES